MTRHKFSELRAKMTPQRQARNAEAAKKMMAELLLSEMRRETGMTQRQLASALGIKQPTLAQMEKQGDMQISTLRRLVEALGGELEIIAHLPSGDVAIKQFREAS